MPNKSPTLNRFPLFGLFDLHKAWRDENKVGFNRVDLDKLLDWLGERTG